MLNKSKAQNVVWVVGLAVIWAALPAITARSVSEADRRADEPAAAVAANSVLYRFDPASQTFITITLPTNSYPTDLEVVGQSPAQVWVAEYGSGRIGRVVFTDTTTYHLIEYPIATPAGSPYRLTVSGGVVWFTERGADRVGRLNSSTGVIDEFSGHGLSANAGLSDIQMAPNGRLWIGAEWSKRLVRLIVTSTVDYSFKEYTDTLRPTFGVAPASIAVEDNNSIWLAIPSGSVAAQRLAKFTPSTEIFDWSMLLNGSQPQELAIAPGNLWFSDKPRNELTQIELGTNTILNPFGPITRPVRLAAESSTVLWSALHTRPPAIGRLQAGTPPSSTVTTYNLPDPRLTPSAIDVAADGAIWVAAYRSELYLPIIRRT